MAIHDCSIVEISQWTWNDQRFSGTLGKKFMSNVLARCSSPPQGKCSYVVGDPKLALIVHLTLLYTVIRHTERYLHFSSHHPTHEEGVFTTTLQQIPPPESSCGEWLSPLLVFCLCSLATKGENWRETWPSTVHFTYLSEVSSRSTLRSLLTDPLSTEKQANV